MQQLRNVNEALVLSLLRQHELAVVAAQTEKRLSDAELVRQRQLALTNALRVSTVGELASGLAHELTQPLSSISSLTAACVNYMDAGSIDQVKLHDLLSEIAREALRAAGIIAHLRSFVDKGQVRLEEADGPARRIELRVRSAKGMAVVSVRDTGTGVSGPSAERIFQAFFTTKTKGLGVGLALSRSIVEAHRGRIWMEAPPGGGPGTVACFSIPLRRARRKPTVAAPRASAGAPS